MRWNITLCDPIWHVTLHSSELEYREELYYLTLTLPGTCKLFINLASKTSATKHHYDHHRRHHHHHHQQQQQQQQHLTCPRCCCKLMRTGGCSNCPSVMQLSTARDNTRDATLAL